MSQSSDESPEAAPATPEPAGGAVARKSVLERWLMLTSRPWVVAAVLGGSAVIAIAALVLWSSPRPDAAPDLAPRVAALEKQVNELRQRGQASAVANEFAQRLSALEQKLAELPQDGAPSFDANALSDLRQRVDATAAMLTELTTRLDALETRGPPASGGAPVEDTALAALRQSTAQLQQALSDLTGRVQALEGRPTAQEDLTALGERVAALEKMDVDTLTKRAATALAVANLVRATQGSGPFKTELGALALIAPDDPALAKLSPQAEMGLPTRETLALKFNDKISDILCAAERADDTWWLEVMWTNLTCQVAIRERGAREGEDTDAIVARIEAELAERDLAQAASEAQKLTGPARDEIAEWLAQAEARVALDRLVTDINGRLLAEIATEE